MPVKEQRKESDPDCLTPNLRGPSILAAMSEYANKNPTLWTNSKKLSHFETQPVKYRYENAAHDISHSILDSPVFQFLSRAMLASCWRCYLSSGIAVKMPLGREWRCTEQQRQKDGKHTSYQKKPILRSGSSGAGNLETILPKLTRDTRDEPSPF